MMRKKIVITIVIVVVLAIGVYQVFFKKEKPAFTLVEVSRGNIVQEISETGQVKKGEEINLSFKSSGEIEGIYVEIGDKVEAGEKLAKIDTRQLEIQLQEAKAGSAVIEAKKQDAQISLEAARQSLEDTLDTANEKIEKTYKDALSALDDVYLKIYNAFNYIDLLKRTYFERGDIESIAIADNKDTIERALNSAKFYINQAKSNQGEEDKSSSSPFADARENKEDTDIALSKVGEALLKTKTALENIRNTIDVGGYRDIVSIADKSSLDTHKLNINTAYSNIISGQANISLTRATNQAEINSAKSKVSGLENQLQETQEGLYQAQINQAKAQIQLLENQIKEATIVSPVAGQIVKINKKVGELAQPMLQDVVISLLPTIPFEIETDIYEEDVIKINIGNEVDISLIAFPEKTFRGKVVVIEPAEKIIEGVVYYKVKIFFEEETPEDLKPGMTVDIKIKTASRENVLVVPGEAIEKRNGKKIIQVLKNKTIKDREVEIGLEGSQGMVEIISGLEEGERIIIR